MKRFTWEHIWSSGDHEVVAVYVEPDSSPWEVEAVCRIRGNMDVLMPDVARDDVAESIDTNADMCYDEDGDGGSWSAFVEEYGLELLDLFKSVVGGRITQIAARESIADDQLCEAAIRLLQSNPSLPSAADVKIEEWEMAGEFLDVPTLVLESEAQP